MNQNDNQAPDPTEEEVAEVLRLILQTVMKETSLGPLFQLSDALHLILKEGFFENLPEDNGFKVKALEGILTNLRRAELLIASEIAIEVAKAQKNSPTPN